MLIIRKRNPRIPQLKIKKVKVIEDKIEINKKKGGCNNNKLLSENQQYLKSVGSGFYSIPKQTG